LTLDLFIGSHVEKIFKNIRERAICQYVSPFSSVDMNKMATTFGTDVKSIEKELAKLIQDKSIEARIDSHNKILYAKQSNQKNVTFKAIQNLGSKYQTKTEKNLLRMNVLKHQDFQIKPLKKLGGVGHLMMMGDPRQKKNF
jgi:COP9 signalosome complex subunit 1